MSDTAWTDDSNDYTGFEFFTGSGSETTPARLGVGDSTFAGYHNLRLWSPLMSSGRRSELNMMSSTTGSSRAELVGDDIIIGPVTKSGDANKLFSIVLGKTGTADGRTEILIDADFDESGTGGGELSLSSYSNVGTYGYNQKGIQFSCNSTLELALQTNRLYFYQGDGTTDPFMNWSVSDRISFYFPSVDAVGWPDYVFEVGTIDILGTVYGWTRPVGVIEWQFPTTDTTAEDPVERRSSGVLQVNTSTRRSKANERHHQPEVAVLPKIGKKFNGFSHQGNKQVSSRETYGIIAEDIAAVHPDLATWARHTGNGIETTEDPSVPLSPRNINRVGVLAFLWDRVADLEARLQSAGIE
jgi:hypothetical protein